MVCAVTVAHYHTIAISVPHGGIALVIARFSFFLCCGGFRNGKKRVGGSLSLFGWRRVIVHVTMWAAIFLFFYFSVFLVF